MDQKVSEVSDVPEVAWGETSELFTPAGTLREKLEILYDELEVLWDKSSVLSMEFCDFPSDFSCRVYTAHCHPEAGGSRLAQQPR